MQGQSFTRQELYDLVWSESVLSLSRKYNISDVGLRKICIKNNIPLPKAGHWPRVKFGKKSPRAPLPSDYVENSNITLVERDKRKDKESPDAFNLLKKEIEDNLNSKLIVPDRLINPDALVIAARDRLTGKSHHDSVALNITVARESIGRALRFFDTLIKALRARGHDVKEGKAAASAIIAGEDFNLKLSEQTRKEIVNGDQIVQRPTGILFLSSYRNWRDGKLPLEKQLSKIIAQFELTAKERNHERIEREKMWAKERAKEKRHKQFKLQREVQLIEFKRTIERSQRWHTAENLRRYIDAIEQRGVLLKNPIFQEITGWITWARGKADWYDPFIESDDKLFRKVNREVLLIDREGYWADNDEDNDESEGEELD